MSNQVVVYQMNYTCIIGDVFVMIAQTQGFLLLLSVNLYVQMTLVVKVMSCRSAMLDITATLLQLHLVLIFAGVLLKQKILDQLIQTQSVTLVAAVGLKPEDVGLKQVYYYTTE